jgi:transposase InsO family protein
LGLGFTEAQELHKRVVHKFKRRRVIAFNINSIWASDLMHTSDFTNLKYKYLLNVIDLFSKYPLKSKSANDVIEGFSYVFARAKLEKLWTDQGTEFLNNKFKDFLKQNNIELYHVYNEGKSVVVERFNRTLGELLSKK